jgi:hypothetical protein
MKVLIPTFQQPGPFAEFLCATLSARFGMRGWFSHVDFENDGHCSYDPENRCIHLRSHFLNLTVDECNALIDKDKRDFQIGSGLKCAITHEFGHAVNAFIIDRIKQYCKDNAQSVLNSWFLEKLNVCKIVGFPSGYAHKNMDDWFAEQFTKEIVYGPGFLLAAIDAWLETIRMANNEV